MATNAQGENMHIRNVSTGVEKTTNVPMDKWRKYSLHITHLLDCVEGDLVEITPDDSTMTRVLRATNTGKYLTLRVAA